MRVRPRHALVLSIAALLVYLWALAGAKYPRRSPDLASYSTEDLIRSIRGLNNLRLYDSAATVGQYALQRLEQDNPISDSSSLATVLHLLGSVYSNQSRYDTALATLGRAVEIATSLYGVDSDSCYLALFDAGTISFYHNRFIEAEPYLNSALEAAWRSTYRDSVRRAEIQTQLGVLYYRSCRYGESLSHLTQALELWRSIGLLHGHFVATALNNLGNIARALGDDDEAYDYYRQAEALRVFDRGPKDPSLAEQYNNLAGVLVDRSQYLSAESYFRKAIALREGFYGKDHSILCYPLTGLGRLYTIESRYVEADSVLQRALRNCLGGYGARHLLAAEILFCMGDLRRSQGDLFAAETLYVASARIKEAVLGEGDPQIASEYRAMALTTAKAGNLTESLSWFMKSVGNCSRLMRLVFPYAAEDQRLSFVRAYPLVDDALLSLALERKTPELQHAALEMLSNGKALVSEELSRERRLANTLSDSTLSKLQNDLRQVNTRLFTAQSIIQSLSDSLFWVCSMRDSLKSLQSKRDSLGMALSQYLAKSGLARTPEWVPLSQIAGSLAGNSLLLELVRYQPFKFDTLGSDVNRTGPDRYLAATFRRNGEIHFHDLGPASQIDSLIALARIRIADDPIIRRQQRETTKLRLIENSLTQLHDLVLAPLAEDLRGCSEIIVAPDCQFDLLPLAVLRDTTGEYAIQKYSISSCAAGRDLVQRSVQRTGEKRAVILADPTFDHLTAQARAGGRRRVHYFDRMVQSRIEGDSIAQILRADGRIWVDKCYGDTATEEALKDLAKSPDVLHIITHARYLSREESRFADNSVFWGLNRSILAFSGANWESSEGGQDGVLTGLEASELNLHGTDLVVLSACETGLGEITPGEVVLGLPWALRLAGAKTVVTTLWRIPEKESREIMTSFYRSWADGFSKGDAIRSAQLQVLNRQDLAGFVDPYFWGGFTLAGSRD